MHCTYACLVHTTAADIAVDELGAAVTSLVRAWRCAGRRLAERSPSLLNVAEMARLLGAGERRLGELAELRGVDQSVISRQVAELEQHRLVSRRPDPTDRRASLVRLTEEGLAVLHRADALRRDWLRTALADSEVRDVEVAARLVTALAGQLTDRAGELARLHPQLVP